MQKDHNIIRDYFGQIILKSLWKTSFSIQLENARSRTQKNYVLNLDLLPYSPDEPIFTSNKKCY